MDSCSSNIRTKNINLTCSNISKLLIKEIKSKCSYAIQNQPQDNSEKKASKSHHKPVVYNLNVLDAAIKLDCNFDLRKVLKIPETSFPVKDTSIEFPKGPSKERQSPINLDSKVVQVKYQKLSFTGYGQTPKSMTATDNGETIKVTAEYESERPYIRGGPFSQKYVFMEFHFHWGMENSVGSDHLFYKARFPMEVHVVHKREDLPLEEAFKYYDGLAVISYFILIHPENNIGLQYIVDMASEIRSKKSASIEKFPLSLLFPPFEKNFYHYSGALTKPPYAECVTWINSTLGLGISQEQLNAFRDMARGNSHMENNYRKTFPLNGRTLYFSTDLV